MRLKVLPRPEKVTVFLAPTNVTELQAFLGLAIYLILFILS